MSDIKRAVIWLVALVAVVIAGDHLLAWMLHRVVLRSQFRYSRLYRGGNHADVIVLGDSRGAHSFYAPAMEELTRQRVLNLSNNSMSPCIAEALLLDYLDHNPPPRMVVLEVTGAIVSDVLIGALPAFAGLSPRLQAMYAERFPVEAVAGSVFKLLPLNSDLYFEVLRFMRRTDQDSILRTAMPAALGRKRTPWRLVPRVENVAALARMVRLLRRRGIEVRLVVTPYAPANVPANVPGFLRLLTKRVQAPVWNYAGAITDLDAFADGVHLNERGSRELLKILHRDGFFGMARPAPRF